MIRNRSRLATSPSRRIALDCIAAGIDAAQPDTVVANTVSIADDRFRVRPVGVEPVEYDLDRHDEVVVLGGGKAAAGVAAALEAALEERIVDGIVVTDTPEPTNRVEIAEGDHPIPSERNVTATARLLERARAAGEDTLVLFVLTGGASALLAAPAGDVGLSALQRTTDALLDSGASIHEINAVRKHLSAIKGGQLAAAVRPARLVTLAISDVVGDDLSVIGSGPTVPDPSTYADAIDVLERYGFDVPSTVQTRLERGAQGDVPETPKPGDAAFDRASAHVIANGFTAIDGARAAVPADHEVCVLTSRLEGEARDLATPHVAVAAEVAATGNPVEPPAVLLTGGEATVTVRGDGEGGPSQEFALATALAADAIPGVVATDAGASPTREAVVAAVDTDGRDGATDAAGALLDAETVATSDISAAEQALTDNDVTPFLAARDALIRTGRTGTNVNDLRVICVGSADGPSADSSS